MDDKFIMMGIDDERSKSIASVLGNKTAKKILNYLADNAEQSEEDIARDLGIPINTVEYNLKKLLHAGLVEKSKKFFWSKKGKKIDLYKVAKKHIIISPKSTKVSSKLKSILPVALISGAVAVALKYLIIAIQPVAIAGSESKKITTLAQDATAEASNIFMSKGSLFFNQASPIWVWFLTGAFFAIAIFTILNWRKI